MNFNAEYETEISITGEGMVLIEQEDEFGEISAMLFSVQRLCEVASAAREMSNKGSSEDLA